MIVIPGEPVGKGRPRSMIMRKRDGSQFVHVYTPKETVAYETRVRTLAQLAVNQARWAPKPAARFRVLLRVFRTHEGRGPDLDNVLKGILDSLNGIAWRDDALVREVGMVLVQDRERPRAEVTVSEIGTR